MAPKCQLATEQPTKRQHEIVKRAIDAVATHDHFRGRAHQFQFDYHDEVLVVHGAVPSFYLKQVLQTLLRNIEGVRAIDNQVQVISAHGLSGDQNH